MQEPTWVCASVSDRTGRNLRVVRPCSSRPCFVPVTVLQMAGQREQCLKAAFKPSAKSGLRARTHPSVIREGRTSRLTPLTPRAPPHPVAAMPHTLTPSSRMAGEMDGSVATFLRRSEQDEVFGEGTPPATSQIARCYGVATTKPNERPTINSVPTSLLIGSGDNRGDNEERDDVERDGNSDTLLAFPTLVLAALGDAGGPRFPCRVACGWRHPLRSSCGPTSPALGMVFHDNGMFFCSALS